MIGMARIRTRPDGLYEPDDGGGPAVIAPVYDSGGELADLCAWDLDAPETWWLRHGDVAVLGGHALAVAAYFGGSIRLYSTPQAWFLGGQRGVCVLLWDAPLDDLFAGVGHVVIGDEQHHHRLMNALRKWEPRIVSREVRHAA